MAQRSIAVEHKVLLDGCGWQIMRSQWGLRLLFHNISIGLIRLEKGLTLTADF
jgi:hypothetical protein